MRWWTSFYFVYGIAVLGYVWANQAWKIDSQLSLALAGGLGACLIQLFRETRKSLQRYVPADLLAAKIVNEQIRLTVSTVNALALAVAGVGVLGPMLSKGVTPVRDLGAALAVVVAFWMHVAARSLLSELKSETAPESPKSPEASGA